MPKGKSRRNIGKRKWRRNKSTNPVQDMYLNQAKEVLAEEPSNPIKKLKVDNVTSLFKIDTTPNNKVKLDKDRFKKRIELPLAKLDEKKVEDLVKKAKKDPKILERNNINNQENEIFDLWGSEAKKPLREKPNKKKKHEVDVPTVIPPHPGQSINPSLKAQKELMELVVEQTELKKGEYGSKKVKIGNFQKKRTKIKSKKQEEHIKKVRELQEKKQREKDERLAGKYLLDFRKKMEEKPKLLEKKRVVREKIKEKIKNGMILPTKRKIGQRRYKGRALEFKELDEVDPKLANAGANQEALREQFDGIFRKGMLEPYSETKAKKRGNLPEFKYHTNPNLTWEEREKGIGKMAVSRGQNVGMTIM